MEKLFFFSQLAFVYEQNEREEISKRDFTQQLTNPYIILVGIEKVSSNKWSDLRGIGIDLENMYRLWHDIYNYHSIAVAYCGNTSKKMAQLSESNKYNNVCADKRSFCDFLAEIRNEIEFKSVSDGLIFYFSGHGANDKIVLNDGTLFEMDKISDIFDGECCRYLRSMAKIMIFDTARGEKKPLTLECVYSVKNEKSKIEKINKNSNDRNDWIDERFHPNSGFAMIYANTKHSVCSSHAKLASILTRAICSVLSQDNYNMPLRDMILDIRRETKIMAGPGMASRRVIKPAQLVDFHETLEYNICLDKYTAQTKRKILRKVDESPTQSK